MTKMSFMDKIGILFEIITSSKQYIIIFLILLLIGYILTSTNRKKGKIFKGILLSIYLIVLGTIIYTYRSNLGNIFDYMMNNLFIVIYFPNLAIYLAAILITNIIMWTSVLNNKISRVIKNINVTVYCSIMYLLVLILNIIKENKLDVFIQSSVYGNSDARALIELSSTIFVIWVVFLMVYKLIKPIFMKPTIKQADLVKQHVQLVEQKVITQETTKQKNYQPTKKIEEKIYSPTLAPSMIVGNIKSKKEEKIYKHIDTPHFIMGNKKYKPEKIYHAIETPTIVAGNVSGTKKEKEEKIYRQIPAPYVVTAYNNTVKVEKTQPDTKMYDDLLTLDDYKLLLSILREQKEKEQQEKDRKARIDKEQAKFRELQELYRGVM